MSLQPKRQVVVRRMGQRSAEAAPVLRKPGERVGLTKEQILAAARRVLAKNIGPISVKAVAADLGVAHNSISSRLRRTKTTLEQELTADFLATLSKPMMPGKSWRDDLLDLFGDALRACDTHPGLARAVTPWLAHSPHLCPDFTERVLHLLTTAGLSKEASENQVDVVIAALCGMLSVRFPGYGKDPRGWASSIAKTMDAVQERRHPLFHRSREGLARVAKDKVPGRKATGSGAREVHQMAGLAIRSIEGKMRN